MSQVIENWAEVDGVIDGVSAADGDDLTLHVRIHAARSVRGFANLLDSEVGDVIAVRVRDLDTPPPPGAMMSGRVRKVGIDRFVADPGSLQIT